MSPLSAHLHSAQNTPHAASGSALLPNGILAVPRPRSPRPSSSTEADVADDDPRSLLFKALFAATEAKIDALFEEQDRDDDRRLPAAAEAPARDDDGPEDTEAAAPRAHVKRAARTIDEDEYDDESEEECPASVDNVSPLKAKSTGSLAVPHLYSPPKIVGIPPSPALTSFQAPTAQWQAKSSDDVRKRLEEDKKAAEEAARRSFQKYFYPVDNDKDAMMEQQKLEESDRQVDIEMSGQGPVAANQTAEGSLSQANLGASSLVLKHLIARIDAKRQKVQASDQELRNLMIEVKKNRSKWASEDKIGQEELYEAAEKVLSEIKAMTEHSQPFLQRVNKRDAPDYYLIIKHPMDLSTMTKKLKAVQYKSKQEFVDDLNLIWSNCLKYNANPDHFLRKHALRMRKETEKLVPLIPDIVIRGRAEVEAEERRLHAAENDLEGVEDSDDEPIIAARGRKAPGKKAKKGANARKAPAGMVEGTPGADTRPLPNGLGANPKHDLLRADSEIAMDGSQNGWSTPPPGTHTPVINGVFGLGASSQADPMDIDGISVSNGIGASGAEVDHDDPEYRLWKQVTKKDRALVAAERHRLFKADRLNPDEPALLRSKAGMRRWVRLQKDAEVSGLLAKRKGDVADDGDEETGGETLAEGIEGTEEKVLPDYYDPLSAIPAIDERIRWIEDSEGAVAPASDETLRVIPRGFFTGLDSTFTRKMTANMRQMQETRKVCAKIGVVKQMQLQSQMYQNQFQKYDPEPFSDHDVEAQVVSDDGPVMSSTVCRMTMQRAVAKIFYAAGFEECQPSALDAITDLATDYLVKLARTLGDYMEKPRIPVLETLPGTVETRTVYKRQYTLEEGVLQCLQKNGIELEALENYVQDDADRMTSKLGVLHERMKAHLAELLRPALSADAGEGGVNAFNDGSEQFVGGDFAEDLGEDFFGFKELGLDKEFGLSSFSVPLHLLQNRMHSAYQAQNPSTTITASTIFPPPAPYPAVTISSLSHEIGLVQTFFRGKFAANNNAPLVEDDDLPQKQRFPKPRLPPTGKITSPRKKPVREAGPGKGHPKKKMRFVDGQGWVKESEAAELERKRKEDDRKRLRIETGAGMERLESRDGDADADAEGEVDDDGDGSPRKTMGRGKSKERADGMISPESLEAL